MNLQEKKKLDKIIIEDIDRGIDKFNSRRNAERSKLEKKLLTTGEVGKMAIKFRTLYTELKTIENRLEKLGFDVSSYSGTVSVSNSSYGSSEKPAEIREFNKETHEKRERIEALKKQFALRLYADNEEAKALFASLEAQIAKLV